uniref:HTH La-type RNA-binding domain-containing protein n=1 Tax=Calcidiscus leptoporus TaxID=127549 RepID=A0A6U5FFQ7_9EUKA
MAANGQTMDMTLEQKMDEAADEKGQRQLTMAKPREKAAPVADAQKQAADGKLNRGGVVADATTVTDEKEKVAKAKKKAQRREKVAEEKAAAEALAEAKSAKAQRRKKARAGAEATKETGAAPEAKETAEALKQESKAGEKTKSKAKGKRGEGAKGWAKEADKIKEKMAVAVSPAASNRPTPQLGSSAVLPRGAGRGRGLAAPSPVAASLHTPLGSRPMPNEPIAYAAVGVASGEWASVWPPAKSAASEVVKQWSSDVSEMEWQQGEGVWRQSRDERRQKRLREEEASWPCALFAPRHHQKEQEQTQYPAVDAEALPKLEGAARVGDGIAYKVLELLTSWSPEPSEWRFAEVTEVEADGLHLTPLTPQEVARRQRAKKDTARQAVRLGNAELIELRLLHRPPSASSPTPTPPPPPPPAALGSAATPAAAVKQSPQPSAASGGSAHSTRSQRYDRGESVVKQVEYYFSPENLERDAFMREQLDANPDGYLSLTLICSFNRVKKTGLPVEEVARILTASERLQVDIAGLRVRSRRGDEQRPQLDEIKKRLVAHVSALG